MSVGGPLKCGRALADQSDMGAGGAGGGAWRGAVAGAAAVLVAQVLLLVINQHWFGIGGPSDNLHDGLNDLIEVLFLLALLPVAMLLAGQLVGRALQLRRWFAVGLLGPVVFLRDQRTGAAIGALSGHPCPRGVRRVGRVQHGRTTRARASQGGLA